LHNTTPGFRDAVSFLGDKACKNDIKNCNNAPPRRRGQNHINRHEKSFLFSGLSPENKIH
jgi:hypothetical protein